MYDIVNLLLNAVIGLIVVAKRLVLLISQLSVTFWRLDISTASIPGFDSGHNSYCAMLVLDHVHTCPLLQVFCGLVITEIENLRALDFMADAHGARGQPVPGAAPTECVRDRAGANTCDVCGDLRPPAVHTDDVAGCGILCCCLPCERVCLPQSRVVNK